MSSRTHISEQESYTAEAAPDRKASTISRVLTFHKNRFLASLDFLLRPDFNLSMTRIEKNAQKAFVTSSTDFVRRGNRLSNPQRALRTLVLLKKSVKDLLELEVAVSDLVAKYGKDSMRAAVPKRFLTTPIPFRLVEPNGSILSIELGTVIHRIFSLDPTIREKSSEVLRNIKDSIDVHDSKFPASTSTLTSSYSAREVIRPWGMIELK